MSILFILNTCRLGFFPLAFHLEMGEKSSEHHQCLLFVYFEPATALWCWVFPLWKHFHCLFVSMCGDFKQEINIFKY